MQTNPNLRYSSTNISILMVILALSLFSGCASLDVTQMVPDAPTTAFKNTGQSIRTISVRGEQDSVWGGPSYAKKEEIHEAVALSLSGSGLFGSVDRGQGDLELLVLVRSQDQKVSLMLEYTGLLTVTYRFSDQNGNVVWTKTLESSGSSHAFSGATRTRVGRERTVKANLTALLSEIEASWP